MREIERFITSVDKYLPRPIRAGILGMILLNQASGSVAAEGDFVSVYSQINTPNGPAGGRGTIGCLADGGYTVIVSSGDVNWIDGVGRDGKTPGKSQGEDRATIYAIEGPCGPGKGGEVNLDVTNLYNAVEVWQNPDGAPSLSGSQLAKLINAKVVAMRDPNNHNGKNGGGLTGPIDVVVVKGQNSHIKERRVIEPGEWAADDDPAHQ